MLAQAKPLIRLTLKSAARSAQGQNTYRGKHAVLSYAGVQQRAASLKCHHTSCVGRLLSQPLSDVIACVVDVAVCYDKCSVPGGQLQPYIALYPTVQCAVPNP